MNCRHAEKLLSDHFEGLLSQGASERLTAHLDGCSACRERREAMKALGAVLRQLPAPLPPAGLRRRALDRWTAEQAAPGHPPATRSGAAPRIPILGSRPWSPPAVPVVLALAAAALAAGLCFIPRSRHPRLHSGTATVALNSHPERPTSPVGLPGAPHPAFLRRERAHPFVRPEGGGLAARRRVADAGGESHGQGSAWRAGPRLSSPAPAAADDLVAMNRDPGPELRRWVSLPPDQWQQIEDRVRAAVHVRDDFVTIPFPRIASLSDRAITQAVESYKREAAIVDPRLSREVTCAFKGTALSDLCDQLKVETGIELTAGSSVADEKVTVFCEKLPLREVMRQLSRPFGYTWLRSSQALGVGRQALGDHAADPNAQRLTPNASYRYELVQDLRSQLLEEELRNRDRDAALLALEKDLDQYRPYLDLSPDEALAREKTASPAEKPILGELAGKAWGPLHVYFRLSSQEQAALRAGQEVRFSEAPRPGEKLRPEMGERVLPPEIARGVLQSVRFLRLVKTDEGWEYSPGDPPPAALPPAQLPEARAWVSVRLDASDLGHFALGGNNGVFTIGPDGGVHWGGSYSARVGTGRSLAVQKTDNAAANATLSHDPTLAARVTVAPVASSPWTADSPLPLQSKIQNPKSKIDKVTSAEVLEALHRVTGAPIVADFYTRLFKRDAVSVRSQPLFEALNQLGDAMRMRWHKEGGWLQLRSLTFFDDRRKEVPNRLLSRWAESRRRQGVLSLDDLVEIAQLPDAQLDAAEMAEGAREWWGLAEWDLACGDKARLHLRYLAQLTPEQRREAMSAAGLPFTAMSLPQQQQFLAFGLGGDPLRSLDELAGATLRVEYTQPGQFQWGEPGWSGYYTRWVIPMGPGPQDRRVPRPPVIARTRQEALAAVRRLDPQLQEALLRAVDRADPRAPQALDTFAEQQIFPTQRNLTFVYIPGATNARSIFVQSAGDHSCGYCNYRLR